MPELLKSVFLQKGLVDLLLLLGTSQLCGYPVKILRVLAAAVLGGIYTSACLLTGFYFLGNFLWRSISFMVMALIAYGLQKSTLRQLVVFALLNLAMSGAIELLGDDGIKGILCAIIVLILLYFSGKTASKRTVPVELNYGDKHLALTALHDTGNTLCDPITGRGARRKIFVVRENTAGGSVQGA